MEFTLRAESDLEDGTTTNPESGHLSASWEIAVVVSLLILLIAIISTVVWHTRRTRARRRMARLQPRDAEAAGEVREKTPPHSEFSRDGALSKPPPAASAQSSTQSPKTSSDAERTRPGPRYYWDHR
ncbi:hypothetical protein B0H15DRAFT_1022650 [Mycena belliarum]|uniref:Uncharacterized protein n=1 Tax=Mycena belliarum TaxID=1033014 RepID=A0AAD6U2K8_9AGAR|nr:hypothetical protein B0H15DRAFT_1022650 [Mycena belliae]